MFKHIKLRFEILAVFLSLLVATSVIIIVFTYREDSKQIYEFSQGTIDRVSSLIEQRTACLIGDFEKIPLSGVGTFLRHPKIEADNKELILFYTEKMQFHPNLYAFYVGSVDGSALLVFNLSVEDKPYSFSDSKKPVPPGSEYAYILVDRSKGQVTCTYLDKDLNTILVEPIRFGLYDPRNRPWYVGAQKTGKVFWTDVFRYEPTSDSGIAVAVPAYDAEGNLVGVVGADLSLKLLAQFLGTQKVGKSGKAYILDGSGKILIPDGDRLMAKIIAGSFQEFSKNKTSNLSYTQDKVRYLVSIQPFPLSAKDRWYIAIVEPFADYFAATVAEQKNVILVSLAILVLASLLIIYFSNHISAPIMTLSKEVDKITHFDMDSQVRVKSDIEEISIMDASIASLRTAMRSFSRYVPREVVKNLIQKGQEIVIGGEKKDITVFFSDISDFTPIVEAFPAETVTTLLSEYFDALSRVILENQGTIDKYIGDGIMAFWGAPQEIPDAPIRACHTALQAQLALSAFIQKCKEKGLPPLNTRMGIHMGNVIVGNFGTSERMDYTAIGDPVNTTARLQTLNKIYHTKILISEQVHSQLNDQFLSRPIDYAEVKGKKTKIKIIELMNWKAKATVQELELATLFTKAYDAFHSQQLRDSQRQFQAILQKFPNDYPTQYYLAKFPS
jgi:adenylate cyclase